MSEDKKYWEGFDYAISLLEEMYGKSNFQHPYNIVDCVKAKVNRLPQEQIRTSIPAASPVSDAVGLVEYTKWVRENWIVGSNETWRRKADYRDKRTDNALVTEYKLSSTITKKQ